MVIAAGGHGGRRMHYWGQNAGLRTGEATAGWCCISVLVQQKAPASHRVLSVEISHFRITADTVDTKINTRQFDSKFVGFLTDI